MGGPGPWIERFTIWMVFHLVGCYLRYIGPPRLEGLEHIPRGGRVLFLSNHVSAVDVVLVPWCIYSKFPQERQHEVAKEELLRVPVLGWIMRNLRVFPVKRGSADRSSLRALEELIRRHKVVLYPEGTRSLDGKLGSGNRMVGRLIREAKPVVIPVAVKGTDKVVPVGKLLPRRGARVEVFFGAPLDLSDEYAIENIKESSVRIVERVMGAIARLLEEGEAPAPRAPQGAGKAVDADSAKYGLRS